MNGQKPPARFRIAFSCTALLTCLLAVILPACASRVQPLPAAAPTQTPPILTATALPPTLTPVPTVDEAAVLFEEGRYQRDAYCSRVFGYRKTAYEALSIFIADNLVGPQDPAELAGKVAKQYAWLDEHSSIPFTRPLTVIILPNPSIGECFSRDHLVFAAPDELDSNTFFEEILGAATGIHEYWVQVGLAALSLGETPDRDALKSWYENSDDLDMTGLFIAYFREDWATEEQRAIARMSAASLLEYALSVENIPPELLVQKINNEVRTRWLASLGVERTVTYPYDGRYARFTNSRSKGCSLRLQADTMWFCLNRMPDQEYFDEISEAEFLINYAHDGRIALTEYLQSEAPSIRELINPEETVVLEVKEMVAPLGYTNGNTISIQNSAVYYYPLHEIVHTFDWNTSFFPDALWLCEGFATYLGMALPIDPQPEKRAVFEELSGRVWEEEVSGVPGISYWYALEADQHKAARRWYLAQGGSMEDEASVDVRLYMDASAAATMYRDAFGGSRSTPIGVKYEILRPNLDLHDQDGLELSYVQAASFVAWLCDTYSIDRVLDVYVNQAEGGLLDGKTYDELKTAWLADLMAKGQGIPMPGQR